jgi:haloacetate dehalogenase
VLWGAKSHTDREFGKVLDVWRDYAVGEFTGGPIDCGHYVPEEAPEATLERFLAFFDAGS